MTASDLDQYQFAAEIAWRQTAEKFGEGSLVAIFSSPEWSQLFDRLAARYAPGHPAGDYRRAALLLRKQQAHLAAEAKEYHYVFRTREFESPRKLTQRNVKPYHGQEGVYLLLGAKRAPLYVGETLDLGARLACHLAAPGSKKGVESFAVILQSQLPSSAYRAPLKVDLVRRYQPAWNC